MISVAILLDVNIFKLSCNFMFQIEIMIQRIKLQIVALIMKNILLFLQINMVLIVLAAKASCGRRQRTEKSGAM